MKLPCRNDNLTAGDRTGTNLPHSMFLARFRKSAKIALGALPPYPAATIAALGLGVLLDMIVVPGPRTLDLYVFLLGLVLGVGAVVGGIWQLLLWLLSLLPPGMLSFTLGMVSAGTTWRLADSFGAFTRLHGPYHWLAVGVLLASGLCGVALAALFWCCVPTRDAGGGVAFRWLSRQRLVAAGLSFGLAILLTIADRMLFVGLYPQAHLALRLAGISAATLAFALLHDHLRLPRMSPSRVAIVVSCTAVPLLMLDANHLSALHGFSLRPIPTLVLSMARRALDFDGDGYAALLGGGDCDDLNPRVHPGAREIPGNSIDDNCVFGDAVERVVDIEQLPVPEGPSPLSIVLITVDTLRPDHMGVYNPTYRVEGRQTTPNIDRWSRESTVFGSAYSPGGWTSIALPSLMRGVYPRRLLWTRYFESNHFRLFRQPFGDQLTEGEKIHQMFPLAANDPQPTLAEQLLRRGIHTVAVVDDGFSSMLQRGVGMDQGFAVYRKVEETPGVRHDDRTAVNMALEELRKVPKGQRFFLWLHLFGPHFPNEQHPGTPSFGESPVDAYDHEIHFMDQQVDRLLRRLQNMKDVAVFFTSDHGEEFARGARFHGYSLDEAIIRIPLLARVPSWPTGFIEPIVSLVDLAPTILGLTETPAPPGLDGLHLAPLARREKGWPRRILISDGWRNVTGGGWVLDVTAAYDGTRKAVFDRLGRSIVLSYPKRPDIRPRRTDPLASDPLTQFLLGYVEETGGALNLQD